MKKMIMYLLLTVSLTGFAQERTDSLPIAALPAVSDFYSHELGVSAGYATNFILGEFNVWGIFGGALNVEYYRNFSSRHAIGVSVSAIAGVFDSFFLAPEYNPEKDNLIVGLTALSGYRHTYYRKNNVSLYFSVFVGVSVYFTYPSVPYRPQFERIPGISVAMSYILFPAHLNVFGCSVGKKNQFYCELGFGIKGMVTLGYKLGIPGNPRLKKN
jgi:hypothetical protein